MTLTSDLFNTIINRFGTPETTTICPKFVKIGARNIETCIFPFEGSGHLWLVQRGGLRGRTNWTLWFSHYSTPTFEIYIPIKLNLGKNNLDKWHNEPPYRPYVAKQRTRERLARYTLGPPILLLRWVFADLEKCRWETIPSISLQIARLPNAIQFSIHFIWSR